MKQPSSPNASSYRFNSRLRPRVAQITCQIVHLKDEEATRMSARTAAAVLFGKSSRFLFCAYVVALFFISAASTFAQTAAHSPGWVVLSVDEYRILRARAYPAERDPDPPPVEATL